MSFYPIKKSSSIYKQLSFLNSNLRYSFLELKQKNRSLSTDKYLINREIFIFVAPHFHNK